MEKIKQVPVQWESEEEWELEQRAFHCNENWPFEEVRKLINDLWFNYCAAADPEIRAVEAKKLYGHKEGK